METTVRSGGKAARAATSTNRSYAGAGPEERKEKRRAQFIEAGILLFGTVGYRKTTVRALCRQAELTDRYFYESFETVEDLLVAVYERLIDEMLMGVMDVIRLMGPDAGADRLVDAGLDAFFKFAEDKAASRIVWLEILSVSPRVDALYNGTLHRFADILLALARGIVPAWRLPDDIGRSLTMAMIGATSELAKDWLMTGYQQPRATLVEAAGLLFKATARLASGNS